MKHDIYKYGNGNDNNDNNNKNNNDNKYFYLISWFEVMKLSCRKFEISLTAQFDILN